MSPGDYIYMSKEFATANTFWRENNAENAINKIRKWWQLWKQQNVNAVLWQHIKLSTKISDVATQYLLVDHSIIMFKCSQQLGKDHGLQEKSKITRRDN